MLYRVYDNDKKEWVSDEVYLSPKDELFVVKRSVLGGIRTLLELPSDRYTYHTDICLLDKNDTLVYEGDYLKAQVAEDRSVVGLVAYAHELSAYVILCVDSDEFFTLGSDVSSDIEIIGNVFDGYEVNCDDESTLSV